MPAPPSLAGTLGALVIDDDAGARRLTAEFLQAEGFAVVAVRAGDPTIENLARGRFHLAVLDPLIDPRDGGDLLGRLRAADPEMSVIVLTSVASVDRAVGALTGGAGDYLLKPLNPDALRLAIHRILMARRLLAENTRLRTALRLYEIGRRMQRSLDPKEIHALALGVACDLGAAVCGLVLAIDPDGRSSAVVASRGVEPEDEAEIAEHFLGEARVRVASVRGDLTTLDLPQLGIAERFGAGWRKRFGGGLLIPVFVDGEPQAYVVLLRPPDAGPVAPETATDLGFVARQLGGALETARRFRDIRDQAERDELTDLSNGRHLRRVLEHEVERARGGGPPPAILFFDLDHFKHVNDAYGHLVGSRLLVEVGRVVRRTLREADVLARFGGDEFVALLRGVDLDTARRVGERVRNTIATHRFLAREMLGIRITTSIGVAAYPTHGEDAEELLRRADAAMYRGKELSRNAVVVGEPLAEAPGAPGAGAAGE